jgi:hypothetical protein
VNLIKTKSRNKLLTSTLNGILLSSQRQRMNLENGCVNFKPTNKMVQAMTSSNLYTKNKESSVPGRKAAAEEEEEEIIFEETEAE